MRSSFSPFFRLAAPLMALVASAASLSGQDSSAIPSRIAAGRAHAAFVNDQGQLVTWGANDRGQLGLETEGGDFGPFIIDLEDVVFVESSADVTFAITGQGNLWSMGSDMNGLLGDGGINSDSRSVREPVSVGFPDNSDGTKPRIRQVVSSSNHAAAIDDRGQLFLWGNNKNFSLAVASVGEDNVRTAPELLDATDPITGEALTWRSVACGDGFTVAIASNGHLYGWGTKAETELGPWDDLSDPGEGADRFGRVALPTRLVPPPDLSSTDPDPEGAVAVNATNQWRSVVTDGFHVMALFGPENGPKDLYVWGRDLPGVLGQEPSTGGTVSDYRLDIPSGNTPNGGARADGWVAVSASRFNSLAIDDSGVLWGWGSNTDNQLNRVGISAGLNFGDNPVTPEVESDFNLAVIESPVWLERGNDPGNDDPVLNNWVEVVSGRDFTIGIATDQNGVEQVYAVGENDFGQLGNGTNSSSSIPNLTQGDFQPRVGERVVNFEVASIVSLAPRYPLPGPSPIEDTAPVVVTVRDVYEDGFADSDFVVQLRFSRDMFFDVSDFLVSDTANPITIDVDGDGLVDLDRDGVPETPATRSLTPSEISNNSATISIPFVSEGLSGIEPGTYSLFGEIVPLDRPDASTDDNVSDRVSVVMSNYDLSPRNVQPSVTDPFNPSRLAPEQPFELTFELANLGARGFDRNYTVRAFLSTDRSYNPDTDTFLGSDVGVLPSSEGSVLAPGERVDFASESGGSTLNLTIPSSIEPGEYFILVRVLSTVPSEEDGETGGFANNVASLEVTLLGSDAAVVGISLPNAPLRDGLPAFPVSLGTGSLDNSIDNVSVSVANEGFGSLTGDIRVDLLFRTGDQVIEVDSNIVTTPIPEGGLQSVVFDGVRIPTSILNSGPIEIGARVSYLNSDSQDATPEDNEFFRSIYASDLDLQPRGIRLLGGVQDRLLSPGQTFDLSFDLRNLGLNSLEANDVIRYSVFLSSDNQLGNDELLEREDYTLTAGISANGQVTIPVQNLELPETTAPGARFLIVSVSVPDEDRREDNPANNSQAFSIEVRPLIDLSVLSIDFSEQQPLAVDQTFESLSFTVRNLAEFVGDGSGRDEFRGSFNAQVLLRPVGSDETEEVLLADRLITIPDDNEGENLSPRETFEVEFSGANAVEFPDGQFSPGDYELVARIVFADGSVADATIDRNSENDFTTEEVELSGYDLTAFNVQVLVDHDENPSTDPVPVDGPLDNGQEIEVQYRLRNLGASSFTGEYEARVYIARPDELPLEILTPDLVVTEGQLISATPLIQGEVTLEPTNLPVDESSSPGSASPLEGPISATIPEDLPAGQYVVVVAVLPVNLALEDDINSNGDGALVLVGGTDPALTRLVLPSTTDTVAGLPAFASGSDIPVSVILRNDGARNINAGAVPLNGGGVGEGEQAVGLRFFFSTDDTIDPTDIEITPTVTTDPDAPSFLTDMNPLFPTQQRTISQVASQISFVNEDGNTVNPGDPADIRLPVPPDFSNLAPGPYFIIAQVVIDDALTPGFVRDANPDNSLAVAQFFLSDLDLSPVNLRLEPTDVDLLDGTISVGDAFQLSFEALQRGLNSLRAQSGDELRYSVYLSADETLEVGNDTFLGQFDASLGGDLDPGDVETIQTPGINQSNVLRIPSFAEIGTNFLLVQLEVKPSSRDENPSNNVSALPVVITPELDLAALALIVPRTGLPFRGEDLTGYSAVVANASSEALFGDPDEVAFEVDVFLSNDDSFNDAFDRRIINSRQQVTFRQIADADPQDNITIMSSGSGAMATEMVFIPSGAAFSVPLTNGLTTPPGYMPGEAFLIARVVLAEGLVDRAQQNNFVARQIQISSFDLDPRNLRISNSPTLESDNDTPDNTEDDFEFVPVAQGQRLSLELDVGNVGLETFEGLTPGTPGTYIVRVYLSSDAVLDGNDRLIATPVPFPMAIIEPTSDNPDDNFDQVTVGNLVLDDEIPLGTQYFLVEILPLQAANENPTDNNVEALRLSVDGRDLTIADFDPASQTANASVIEYGLGAPVNGIAVTVANRGRTAIDHPVSATLWLSSDEVIDENDTRLSTISSEGIRDLTDTDPETGDGPLLFSSAVQQGGDQLLLPFNPVNFPSSQLPGNYKLIVEVQIDADTIPETTLANNTLVRDVRLIAPDLELSLVEFPQTSQFEADATIVGTGTDPDGAGPGFSLVVSNNTIGTVPVPTFDPDAPDANEAEDDRIEVAVYLSADGNLDLEAERQLTLFVDSEDPLGLDDIEALFVDADTNDGENDSLTLPDVAGGEYTLFFVVNPDGNIIENDGGSSDFESRNNVVERIIQIIRPGIDAGPSVGLGRFEFAATPGAADAQWRKVPRFDTADQTAWQSPAIPVGESAHLRYEFTGPAALLPPALSGDAEMEGSNVEVGDFTEIKSPIRMVLNGAADVSDTLEIQVFSGPVANADASPEAVEFDLDVGPTAKEFLQNGSVELYRFDTTSNSEVRISASSFTALNDGGRRYLGIHRILINENTPWLTEFTIRVNGTDASSEDGRMFVDYKFTRNDAETQGSVLLGVLIPIFEQSQDVDSPELLPVPEWRAINPAENLGGFADDGFAPRPVSPLEGSDYAGVEFDAEQTGRATLSTTVFGPALLAFQYSITENPEIDDNSGPVESESRLSFRIDNQVAFQPTFELLRTAMPASYAPVFDPQAANAAAFNRPFSNDLLPVGGQPTRQGGYSYFLIPAGAHELSWVAEKDGGGQVGFYLDNIVMITPPAKNYPDVQVVEVDAEPGAYVLDSTDPVDNTLPLLVRLRNGGADLEEQDDFEYTELTVFLSRDNVIQEDTDPRLMTVAITENNPDLDYLDNGDLVVFRRDVVLPLDIPAAEDYNLMVRGLARPRGGVIGNSGEGTIEAWRLSQQFDVLDRIQETVSQAAFTYDENFDELDGAPITYFDNTVGSAPVDATIPTEEVSVELARLGAGTDTIELTMDRVPGPEGGADFALEHRLTKTSGTSGFRSALNFGTFAIPFWRDGLVTTTDLEHLALSFDHNIPVGDSVVLELVSPMAPNAPVRFVNTSGSRIPAGSGEWSTVEQFTVQDRVDFGASNLSGFLSAVSSDPDRRITVRFVVELEPGVDSPAEATYAIDNLDLVALDSTQLDPEFDVTGAVPEGFSGSSIERSAVDVSLPGDTYNLELLRPQGHSGAVTLSADRFDRIGTDSRALEIGVIKSPDTAGVTQGFTSIFRLDDLSVTPWRGDDVELADLNALEIGFEHNFEPGTPLIFELVPANEESAALRFRYSDGDNLNQPIPQAAGEWERVDFVVGEALDPAQSDLQGFLDAVNADPRRRVNLRFVVSEVANQFQPQANYTYRLDNLSLLISEPTIDGFIPEYTLANNVVTIPGFEIIRSPDLVIENYNQGSINTLAQYPLGDAEIFFQIANRGLAPIQASDEFTVTLELAAIGPNIPQWRPILELGRFDVQEFIPERNAQFPERSAIDVTQFITWPTISDILVGIRPDLAPLPDDDSRVFENYNTLTSHVYAIFITVDSENEVTESSETNIFQFNAPLNQFTFIPVPLSHDLSTFFDRSQAITQVAANAIINEYGDIPTILLSGGLGDIRFLPGAVDDPTTSLNEIRELFTSSVDVLLPTGRTLLEAYAFLNPPFEVEGGDNPLFTTRLDLSPKYFVEDLRVSPSNQFLPYFLTNFGFNNAVDLRYEVNHIVNGVSDTILTLGEEGTNFDLPITAPANLTGFNGLSSQNNVISVSGRNEGPADIRATGGLQITLRGNVPIEPGELQMMQVNAGFDPEGITPPSIPVAQGFVSGSLVIIQTTVESVPENGSLFIIREQLGSDSSVFTVLDIISADDLAEFATGSVVTFIDSFATPGATYNYFLRGINAAGRLDKIVINPSGGFDFSPVLPD
ncbi:MAG: hypothetical protein ACFB21_07985 [Opitutales bacterium]